MVEKAKHDSVAGATAELPPSRTRKLWMVHGVWHDLTEFASRHPGGRFWLEETVGLDITELYETHHLEMDRPNQILRKYRVGPARADYQGFYDYKRDGLYCTLKQHPKTALNPK